MKTVQTITGPDPDQADHFHYFSQDTHTLLDALNFRNLTGVARIIPALNNGIGGSVCWLQKADRTAITEYLGTTGDTSEWNLRKLDAVLVLFV